MRNTFFDTSINISIRSLCASEDSRNISISPVLTSDASISTSISISVKDTYALVRTAMT